MIAEKIQKALNKQINAEMYSAYLYLSMSSWFSSKNLDGFASWMKAQALEEMYHAMKIYGFVQERGGRVELEEISKPSVEWASPLSAFENVVEHERKVTGMIDDLVDLASAEKDHASNNFLQWFVAEQVEEEDTAGGILENMKLAGEKGSGLFMIDRELGQRAFNIPPDLKLQILSSST